MKKSARFVAILAIGLFLAQGVGSAAPAGTQFLSPGSDAASIAGSVARRPDAKLQRVGGSAASSVERLMGKAGIAQWLSAY